MESALEKRELLLANVKPTHYILKLEPSFSTFETIVGVTIEPDIVEDLTDISLNTFQTKIESISLKRVGEEAEKPQSTK
ncbi:hypothetical protein MMC14_005301 [Varicellaria rhodocarpa]|nr:hypothetical protein [Varicellaria rhodocarpa]